MKNEIKTRRIKGISIVLQIVEQKIKNNKKGKPLQLEEASNHI
jgi:hypothetical protein